jgi:hypothetical protein
MDRMCRTYHVYLAVKVSVRAERICACNRLDGREVMEIWGA